MIRKSSSRGRLPISTRGEGKEEGDHTTANWNDDVTKERRERGLPEEDAENRKSGNFARGPAPVQGRKPV
jgi:hypothetical protein